MAQNKNTTVHKSYQSSLDREAPWHPPLLARCWTRTNSVSNNDNCSNSYKNEQHQLQRRLQLLKAWRWLLCSKVFISERNLLHKDDAPFMVQGLAIWLSLGQGTANSRTCLYKTGFRFNALKALCKDLKCMEALGMFQTCACATFWMGSNNMTPTIYKTNYKTHIA